MGLASPRRPPLTLQCHHLQSPPHLLVGLQTIRRTQKRQMVPVPSDDGIRRAAARLHTRFSRFPRAGPPYRCSRLRRGGDSPAYAGESTARIADPAELQRLQKVPRVVSLLRPATVRSGTTTILRARFARLKKLNRPHLRRAARLAAAEGLVDWAVAPPAVAAAAAEVVAVVAAPVPTRVPAAIRPGRAGKVGQRLTEDNCPSA